jgi:hypothetical protein
MNKFLPVWYGGGIGNNRNALCGIGHLSCAGFIFPIHKDYGNYHQNALRIEMPGAYGLISTSHSIQF